MLSLRSPLSILCAATAGHRAVIASVRARAVSLPPLARHFNAPTLAVCAKKATGAAASGKTSERVPKPVAKRMEELCALLNKCASRRARSFCRPHSLRFRYRDAYFNESKSLVPDSEYDSLMRELEQIEERYPHAKRADSPSQKVGATPVRPPSLSSARGCLPISKRPML